VRIIGPGQDESMTSFLIRNGSGPRIATGPDPLWNRRQRLERLLQVHPEKLRGTYLAELLEWASWNRLGQVYAWEGVLQEILTIIQRWELVNEDPVLYGVEQSTDDAPESWNSLWSEHGGMMRYRTIYHCRCGQRYFDEDMICPTCNAATWNAVRQEKIYWSVLFLRDAPQALARAVWQSRNQPSKEERVLHVV
jgi:hypothetical protein